jgi:hypothetical protein
MCFVDFTYKKEMENQKTNMISALEVLDNIKSSLNLADKEPAKTEDEGNGANFEDFVLQTEADVKEDVDAALTTNFQIEGVTYRKTNSTTTSELNKMKLGKTVSNGQNFERPGSDYLLKSNTDLEKGKKTNATTVSKAKNAITVERSSIKAGIPDKLVSSNKLGIKVSYKLDSRKPLLLISRRTNSKSNRRSNELRNLN